MIFFFCRRISELSLDAVKLSKPVADALCLLAKSSNLSCLMLGATNIGAVCSRLSYTLFKIKSGAIFT